MKSKKELQKKDPSKVVIAETKNDKALRVVALREKDKTFFEIGEAVGVDEDAAVSLYKLGKEILIAKKTFVGLSAETSNVLRSHCYSSREEVIHDLKTEFISMSLSKVVSLQGLDEDGFLELCEWAELINDPSIVKKPVEAPRASTMANHYTYQLSWSPGESLHIATCVEFETLIFSADTLHKALEGIRRMVTDMIDSYIRKRESVPPPKASNRLPEEVAA